MRVAIVHDWLTNMGRAEKVELMHHLFPDAPVYTLIYDPNMPDSFRNMDDFLFTAVSAGKKQVSMDAASLMPRAIECLDLREYDLVISSSTSCAKGVLTRADCCTFFAIVTLQCVMPGIFIMIT